jgi:hypothetical protein
VFCWDGTPQDGIGFWVTIPYAFMGERAQNLEFYGLWEVLSSYLSCSERT